MNHHDLIAAPLPKVGSQTPPNGRGTKFTPEKIQQIMNLVEREKSREEIAELVGVTVGSLQAHLFQAWDQPATTQNSTTESVCYGEAGLLSAID